MPPLNCRAIVEQWQCLPFTVFYEHKSSASFHRHLTMTTVSGGGDAQRRLSPIKNAQKIKVKMQRTYFGLRLTSSSREVHNGPLRAARSCLCLCVLL